MRRLLTTTLAAICALALGAMLTPAALAAPSTDVTGTWEVFSGGCGCSFNEVYKMDSSGNVTGTGPQPDWTVTGNVSGSTFTYTDHYDGNYESHVTVTLSPDGNSYEGSFKDNGSATGEIKGKRISGGGKSEEKEKEKEEGPAGKLRSGTGVSCNFEVASGNFTCTAQVGDASGESPQKTPTGIVAFALKPGAEGVFTAGSACSLTASSSGPTAYCSVVYRPGLIAIPPGEQPQIVASYGGDGAFEPSSSEPANQYAVNIEGLENARALDCELFWEAPGCETLLGSPGKTTSCVAIATRCKEAIERLVREHTINLTGEVPASLLGSVDCEQKSGASVSRVRAHAARLRTVKEILERGGNWCEVEAVLKSEDPDTVKEATDALEWDLNKKRWQTEVDIAKSRIAAEIIGNCQGKEVCPTMKGLGLATVEAFESYMESLKGTAGKELSKSGDHYFQLPASYCGDNAAAAANATGYNECLDAVATINHRLERSLGNLEETKDKLGLNRPKPNVAKGSSVGSPLALTAAEHHQSKADRRPKTIYIGAGGVRVHLSTKGKIKLVLAPQARALLRKLKHRGVKQIKATLIIRTTVIGGRDVTRKLALRLRLKAH